MRFPLTVSDLLLMHLRDYGRFSESCFYPRAMTQHGISEELGVSRGYVAQELKRLVELGHVRSELGRVPEASKRLKVYLLTQKGSEEARRLADAIGGGDVPEAA